MTDKLIWTIGHSTHLLDDFITILRSFDIFLVADVRSYPGSARHPHFNRDSLNEELPANGIEYLHLANLEAEENLIPILIILHGDLNPSGAMPTICKPAYFSLLSMNFRSLLQESQLPSCVQKASGGDATVPLFLTT
jgi:hypothetical protein